MNTHLNYFAALCILVLIFTVAYKYFFSAIALAAILIFQEENQKCLENTL